MPHQQKLLLTSMRTFVPPLSFRYFEAFLIVVVHLRTVVAPPSHNLIAIDFQLQGKQQIAALA
jgi:hypothetical protein